MGSCGVAAQNYRTKTGTKGFTGNFLQNYRARSPRVLDPSMAITRMTRGLKHYKVSPFNDAKGWGGLGTNKYTSDVGTPIIHKEGLLTPKAIRSSRAPWAHRVVQPSAPRDGHLYQPPGVVERAATPTRFEVRPCGANTCLMTVNGPPVDV